jgi:hypothetical protein
MGARWTRVKGGAGNLRTADCGGPLAAAYRAAAADRDPSVTMSLCGESVGDVRAVEPAAAILPVAATGSIQINRHSAPVFYCKNKQVLQ